MVNISETVSTR